MRQFLTGHGGTLQGHPNNNVLNSQAVQSSFNRYGDYFLSQAFPEGSPTHPAYPTGHGVVAGACITVLKFFFDGNFVIPNPVVPSSDGLSLQPYTGGDAGQITVNGELNKIAQQHLLWPWNPLRHPLAQRHLLLHPTGRGRGDQHAPGSGTLLRREIHR